MLLLLLSSSGLLEPQFDLFADLVMHINEAYSPAESSELTALITKCGGSVTSDVDVATHLIMPHRRCIEYDKVC